MLLTVVKIADFLLFRPGICSLFRNSQTVDQVGLSGLWIPALYGPRACFSPFVIDLWN